MNQGKDYRKAELRMIPLDRIEVLNPRERNGRVFDQIVGNIQSIGLKKPIVVTPRPGGKGEHYLLICGEGRFKAFKTLGQQEIPAMVMQVDDESAFIMSLTENIARRKFSPLGMLCTNPFFPCHYRARAKALPALSEWRTQRPFAPCAMAICAMFRGITPPARAPAPCKSAIGASPSTDCPAQTA